MNNIEAALIALPLGLLLGIIFYGGLWMTVKYSINSSYAGLLFAGSFFVRIAVTLLGFYYVADNNFSKLLFCLLGFIAARLIITKITKPSAKEVSHEN